jgi:hypothetical protein
MTKEQRKYADNVVKYNIDLYEKLLEYAQSLSDEEEAEKYVKFLAVSSSQECLFKIKEIFTHCKQLFNQSLDIPSEIEVKLNDMKPAFSLKGDVLINVSGMEASEMLDFVRDAVSKSKDTNEDNGDS